MEKPAARLGDMHVCPKVGPGPVPHVGGPILQGSPNVLIDYMPAARVGDSALCIGPPDTISAGSATVFINGKPAARQGDSCTHGGKIIIGSSTVIIGDSSSGLSDFQGNQQLTKTNDLSSEDGFTVEDGTSLALDFLPVVSSIKSLGQLITGTDLVTGEQISRGMETVGIAAGIFPGGKGILKGITKGAKVLGKSDNVVDVTKGIKNTDDMIKSGTKNVKPEVTAEVTVNEATFKDTNQTARPKVQADINQPTLISERVSAKAAKTGKELPNGNMGTAHAEIGSIQQAANAGKTKGADMSMTVTGKDVCGYCKGDIAAAAEKAELKSLTIQATDNKTGLPKTYHWKPGMKSIKVKL